MPKVILSSNYNLDYLFYLPITSFVWNHFGFDCVTFLAEEHDMQQVKPELRKYIEGITVSKTKSQLYYLPAAKPVRSETVAQISRLFGAAVVEDENEYLITGDIDMIPLNSYLYRDFDKRNLYGQDLTDYTQWPMCYVGMSCKNWREFLGIEYLNAMAQIMAALQEYAHKSASQKWEEYWDTDQAYLTDKIKLFGPEKFQNIIRGRERTGYAYKRVDRGHWNWSPAEEYIDAHMLKNPYSEENFEKTYALIEHTLKGVDCTWMKEYQQQFKKLI